MIIDANHLSAFCVWSRSPRSLTIPRHLLSVAIGEADGSIQQAVALVVKLGCWSLKVHPDTDRNKGHFGIKSSSLEGLETVSGTTFWNNARTPSNNPTVPRKSRVCLKLWPTSTCIASDRSVRSDALCY